MVEPACSHREMKMCPGVGGDILPGRCPHAVGVGDPQMVYRVPVPGFGVGDFPRRGGGPAHREEIHSLTC